MGWSSPFAPWVVESWRKYSEAIGGPEIAAEMRKNMVEQAKKKIPVEDIKVTRGWEGGMCLVYSAEVKFTEELIEDFREMVEMGDKKKIDDLYALLGRSMMVQATKVYDEHNRKRKKQR